MTTDTSPKKYIKVSIFGTLSIIASIVLLVFLSKEKDPTTTTVNDFRLESLNHERFYLNKQKGKVVVFTFWTTWCSYCKKQLMDMKKLQSDYAEKEVFIAAPCTDPENLNLPENKELLERMNLPYPILLDSNAAIFKKINNEQVYPTTLIFDQEGRIVFRKKGYSPVVLQQIKSKVDSLLSK